MTRSAGTAILAAMVGVSCMHASATPPLHVAPSRSEPREGQGLEPSVMGETSDGIPPPKTSPNGRVGPPAVVLVTVDGVRWQDVFEGAERSRIAVPMGSSPANPDPRIFGDAKIDDLTKPEGLLPRTWELVARRGGVALGHGVGCGVVRPRNTTHISLPGYLEIFTARRTTCMSNVCPRVATPTVLDAAANAGMSVASISSWEMLDAAATHGGTNVVVSAGTARWPGKRPLDEARLEELVAEGERAKPFPAPNGTYRPDRYTTAIALEYLRVHRPRLLHVGLGDMDEHAHRDDYGAYLLSLREVDTFLGDLADTLESLGMLAHTTVILTSDHGRAAALFREHGPSYPDSGRTFVVAFGGETSHRSARATTEADVIPSAKDTESCASRDLWLTDIAPTIRSLLGLPRDDAPEVIGQPIAEIVGR